MSAFFTPANAVWRFRPNGSKPIEVVGDHKYADDLGTELVVPDGYRTDLTSYPRGLRWVLLAALPFACHSTVILWVIALTAVALAFIIDPFGRAQRASMFHDKAYGDGMERFKADAMYRIIMTNDGVPYLRRTLNYLGVRLFGWIYHETSIFTLNRGR